eukprot:CAMPEP_0202697576 /NCGR_PEP_ID=MMETSP1385-20130828/10922_1 /ASSEMBLY_ACC=CAM_ASM_000861 /TAXON_ID=933848 /ORGANISM="Elphidium margaritaceum" /LENGTH=113 /DNA_ID=CAMNT_0049354075 /DNA_START=30 /DNA_END=371 /DNA_ORIENTATION=+
MTHLDIARADILRRKRLEAAEEIQTLFRWFYQRKRFLMRTHSVMYQSTVLEMYSAKQLLGYTQRKALFTSSAYVRQNSSVELPKNVIDLITIFAFYYPVSLIHDEKMKKSKLV